MPATTLSLTENAILTNELARLEKALTTLTPVPLPTACSPTSRTCTPLTPPTPVTTRGHARRR